MLTNDVVRFERPGPSFFLHIIVVFSTFFNEKVDQFNCSPLQTPKTNPWEGMNPWWLVGCLGLNGPLRQYFSLYRAISQREGERKEKCRWEKKQIHEKRVYGTVNKIESISPEAGSVDRTTRMLPPNNPYYLIYQWKLASNCTLICHFEIIIPFLSK